MYGITNIPVTQTLATIYLLTFVVRLLRITLRSNADPNRILSSSTVAVRGKALFRWILLDVHLLSCQFAWYSIHQTWSLTGANSANVFHDSSTQPSHDLGRIVLLVFLVVYLGWRQAYGFLPRNIEPYIECLDIVALNQITPTAKEGFLSLFDFDAYMVPILMLYLHCADVPAMAATIRREAVAIKLACSRCYSIISHDGPMVAKDNHDRSKSTVTASTGTPLHSIPGQQVYTISIPPKALIRLQGSTTYVSQQRASASLAAPSVDNSTSETNRES